MTSTQPPPSAVERFGLSDIFSRLRQWIEEIIQRQPPLRLTKREPTSFLSLPSELLQAILLYTSGIDDFPKCPIEEWSSTHTPSERLAALVNELVWLKSFEKERKYLQGWVATLLAVDEKIADDVRYVRYVEGKILPFDIN